jgi:hypothetical protein
MSETLTFTGELTVVACWCGMRHAVPAELRNYQQRQYDNGNSDPIGIYCPLGHTHIPAGESKIARIQRQRQWARDEAARERAAREQAEASAAAYKGVATKAKKRAAAAVCPCCNRSFVQLRRHLETKHPDYDPAKASR